MVGICINKVRPSFRAFMDYDYHFMLFSRSIINSLAIARNFCGLLLTNLIVREKRLKYELYEFIKVATNN